MSFQAKSQLQQQPLASILSGLQMGQMMTIIITNAPGASNLEFKHAADTAWQIHPDYDGTPSATNVVMQTLICPSATMQLNFGAAPAADYHVSIVWHTIAEY